MISRLNQVNVFVLDQDRAKAFYTETLGFELRNDAILDGFRWLTVGPKDQKDLNILLAYPAPPMFSPEDAAAIRALVAKGSLSGGVFETADCQKPFEELSAKGVTFLQEPAEGPYGSMRSSETTPETGSASPSPSGSGSGLETAKRPNRNLLAERPYTRKSTLVP